MEAENSKPRIYLAGPIFGRRKSDVRDWREEAAARLSFLGAEPLDPCRRDYTGIEHVDGNSAKIVAEDLAEIDGCAAIIAMVDAPSAGTSMEIFYAAHVRKIPVIAIVPDSIAVSPWISHHAEVIKWSDFDDSDYREEVLVKARSAAIGHACARTLSALSDRQIREYVEELELQLATRQIRIEELEEDLENVRNSEVETQDDLRDLEGRFNLLSATCDTRTAERNAYAIANSKMQAEIDMLRGDLPVICEKAEQ